MDVMQSDPGQAISPRGRLSPSCAKPALPVLPSPPRPGLGQAQASRVRRRRGRARRPRARRRVATRRRPLGVQPGAARRTAGVPQALRGGCRAAGVPRALRGGFLSAIRSTDADDRQSGSLSSAITDRHVPSRHLPLPRPSLLLSPLHLAPRRPHQGLVEIPLRAAAASDPEGYATRPESGPECERARQRRSQCYAPVIAALAALYEVKTQPQPPATTATATTTTTAAQPAAVSNGGAGKAAAPSRGPAGTVGVTVGAGPGGVGNGARPLTASERTSYRAAVLKV